MPNHVGGNLRLKFVAGVLVGLVVSLSAMAQGTRTPIVSAMDPNSIGVQKIEQPKEATQQP